MHNLLDFLRKYNHVFLFLLLEALSFTLLFRFNSYQGSVWFSSANATVAGINRIYGDVTAFLHLQEANRALTDDNVRLQQEVTALRDALASARHDTTYTERHIAEQLAGYRLIPATVVSNSARLTDNYLVIDRGEADGVRAEMGVVGGGGVVGVVYLTAPHHALVIPVTSRKSSISCRVRGQRYFGFLQWEGRSLRQAYLDDIPRYAKVKEGECIETSGYSAMFPPGIFVGRVARVSNAPDGQSFRLDVRLGSDFANLRDVNVVATAHKAEIDTLRTHAERDLLFKD